MMIRRLSSSLMRTTTMMQRRRQLCRCMSTASSSSSLPSPSPSPPTVGPLHGLRVLDLSRILAAPFCTQMLGDAGAEVWKIENPIGGDDTRFWGPPFVRSAVTPIIASSLSTANHYSTIGESAYFMSANRNKHSVCINLKDKAGADIVCDLARHADIVVENWSPGKLDEFGLDYATLSAINPRLIYASLTGYGRDGPLASTPGYDVMAAARGGLMHITGPPSSPSKVGVAITDLSSGLVLHGAILAALYARERDVPHHRGQRVETNLLSVAVANLANIGQNYHVDNSMIGRRFEQSMHESIVPYQAFTCKRKVDDTNDAASSSPSSSSPSSSASTSSSASVASSVPSIDHFICGALNNKQFASLITVIDILSRDVGIDSTWIHDAAYRSNALRVRNRQSLIDGLQRIFDRYDKSTLLSLFAVHNIPSSPINNIGDVFDEPQVVHSRIVQTVQHPTLGDVKLTTSPVTYSSSPSSSSSSSSSRLSPSSSSSHQHDDADNIDRRHTPMSVRMPPPLLGEHTQEVLMRVCGSTSQQLKEWEKKGIIGCYHAIV